MRFRSAGIALTGLAALFLGAGTAHAQAIIASYEFSSVAVDYPTITVAGQPRSLQATLGQTFATIDPPTNVGQNLAFAGFFETGVPFLYKATIALDSYDGSANPINTFPFEVRFTNTDGNLDADLQMFTTDAAGNMNIFSWVEPSHVQAIRVKGPIWLRQTVVPTPPANPLVDAPTAAFTLKGGDATSDNSVNFDDFQVLADAYFTHKGVDALYNPYADFNGDGDVNFDDFQILADNYFTDGDN